MSLDLAALLLCFADLSSILKPTYTQSQAEPSVTRVYPAPAEPGHSVTSVST